MTDFLVPGLDINLAMMRFRLASRELFNNYFRTGGRDEEAWKAQERFGTLEEHLFDALVALPAGLSRSTYGMLQPGISCRLTGSNFAPWMLNRAEDSGYWDHPQNQVTDDAVLSFVAFFDWDSLDLIDWRYVRVLVRDWPSHPELVGKHALIETIYVRFERTADSA
jgi:hypothetical protein